MRRADPLGRAERIPPQNSLFAPSPALTPLGDPRWVWPPLEGRAPHAR